MKNGLWRWKPLGDLFEIGAGKTMSRAAREGPVKVPFLRTSNVLWDEIDLSQLDEMALTPDELMEKCVAPGDLLVCEGGEIGRAAVWDGDISPLAFQNHLHRLRPRADDVEPRFYVYFLQSAFTQLGLFEGAGNKTTIPNLSRNRLADLEVPHPLLAEQRAIAQVLALVRSAVRGHDRAARQAEDLKRAAMRELFTRGLRGEPVKETEIGPVPKSWSLKRSASVFRLSSGQTRPPDIVPFRDASHPWPVVGGNGPMGFSDRANTEDRSILVIGRVGAYCGAVHLVRGPAWITDNALYDRVWIDKSVARKYAAEYLRYLDLNRFRRLGSQPLVTQSAIDTQLIPVPDDPIEQREIVAVLDAIDRKIDLHRRKRALLEELFKSLLHKLMTGEVRVTDLDLSAVPTSAEARA